MTGPGHILFVSSTVGGGSGRSQRELARMLMARGVRVTMLVDDGQGHGIRRRADEQLLDAAVRFAGSATGRLAERLRRRVAGRPVHRSIEGVDHTISITPETCIDDALATGPDLVVGSSISRPTWQRVVAAAVRTRVPTALYLREATALDHLSRTRADVVLANAGSLADQAGALGHRAHLVPSVVTVHPMEQPSTQAVALLVNPIASHGVGRVAALATYRPDIPLVLQESWPLEGERRAVVERLVAAHDNVSLRERTDDNRDLFRDARMLLVPHEIDNRPRTVLEAQANGIAVIAADQPGLRELIGETGVLVPLGADDGQWSRAVGELWDDAVKRRALAAAGRSFAGRADVQPENVVARFLEVVGTVAPALRPATSSSESVSA